MNQACAPNVRCVSINSESFNRDVKGHFHFETISLTDCDAEIRAVERADRIGATDVLLRRR